LFLQLQTILRKYFLEFLSLKIFLLPNPKASPYSNLVTVNSISLSQNGSAKIDIVSAFTLPSTKKSPTKPQPNHHVN
jgi:hypothetical protein